MNQQNETTSSLVFQSANNNGIKTTDGRVASPPSNNAKAQNSPKPRKSTSLPAETVEYLKAWMMSPEHISHPYPTEQEKAKIMADTGIELKQLTNWFVNNRKRYWKPRVEARLQQQAQAQNAAAAAAVLASRRVTTTASNGGFEFLSHNGSQVILQPNTGHIIALDIGQAGNAGSQQQPQQILPSPVLTGHQIHLHNAANLVLPSQHNLLPHFQQNNLSNTKDSRTLFPNLHVNESLSHLIINSSLQNPQTRSSSQNDTNSVSHFGANNTSPSIVYDDSTVSSTNNEDSRTSSFSSTTSRQEIQEHEIEPNDKLNAETRMVMRREVVDVHILRPTFTTIGEESSQPTIKDVTILSNVPRDRIIKSYSKCEISYSFPVHIINERKKVQRRRDAEVVRIKKHFLKLFLSEQNSITTPYQVTTPGFTPTYSAEVSVTESDEGGIDSDSIGESCSNEISTKTTPLINKEPLLKRTLNSSNSEARYIEPDDEPIESPTKRIKTLLEAASSDSMTSVSHWRDACRKAKHYSDAGLPSLEEAAKMFGYAN